MEKSKTKDEVLNQIYLDAKDLKILIPGLGIQQCRNLIDEIRQEMAEKNLYVPPVKPRLALTKIIKKKFGL